MENFLNKLKEQQNLMREQVWGGAGGGSGGLRGAVSNLKEEKIEELPEDKKRELHQVKIVKQLAFTRTRIKKKNIGRKKGGKSTKLRLAECVE